MDNAAFHKSEHTKILIETADCELLFLPPYSPDLNPIEKFWANLKAKIKKLLVSLKHWLKLLMWHSESII